MPRTRRPARGWVVAKRPAPSGTHGVVQICARVVRRLGTRVRCASGMRASLRSGCASAVRWWAEALGDVVVVDGNVKLADLSDAGWSSELGIELRDGER